eukprot:728622_1
MSTLTVLLSLFLVRVQSEPSQVCLLGDNLYGNLKPFSAGRDPTLLMGTFTQITIEGTDESTLSVDFESPIYRHKYYHDSKSNYLFKIDNIGWVLSETASPLTADIDDIQLTCFEDNIIDCLKYRWFWGYNDNKYPILSLSITIGACHIDMCLENFEMTITQSNNAPANKGILNGHLTPISRTEPCTLDSAVCNSNRTYWINNDETNYRWYYRVTKNANWVYGKVGSDRIACAPGYVEAPLFCTTFVYASNNYTNYTFKGGLCNPTASPTVQPSIAPSIQPSASPTPAPTDIPYCAKDYVFNPVPRNTTITMDCPFGWWGTSITRHCDMEAEWHMISDDCHLLSFTDDFSYFRDELWMNNDENTLQTYMTVTYPLRIHFAGYMDTSGACGTSTIALMDGNASSLSVEWNCDAISASLGNVSTSQAIVSNASMRYLDGYLLYRNDYNGDIALSVVQNMNSEALNLLDTQWLPSSQSLFLRSLPITGPRIGFTSFIDWFNPPQTNVFSALWTAQTSNVTFGTYVSDAFMHIDPDTNRNYVQLSNGGSISSDATQFQFIPPFSISMLLLHNLSYDTTITVATSTSKRTIFPALDTDTYPSIAVAFRISSSHLYITFDGTESDDIADDEIASHLLKFEESKWDFCSESVFIYRLQMDSIDHSLMLPHPLSSSFPEFFSTNPIPKKEQFLASILPPKDTTQFPTTSKQWVVRVIVAQTTAKQLIDKIVDGKLRISLNTSQYEGDTESIMSLAPEFLLKVVGCEEYILYDDSKLIVDYEAVRKAVRNEDDVIFQLDHRPDLHRIEAQCFERHQSHMAQFSTKYDAVLTDKMREKYNYYTKYVRYSYGEGMSLDELAHAKRNNGFTKEYQKKLLNLDESRTSVAECKDKTLHIDDEAPPTRQRSRSHGGGTHNPNKTVENIEIMNQFAVSMKTLSGAEILNHLPSLRDTEWLQSSIPRVADQIRHKREIREMLLYEFRQFYRIKMSFMTNVTQLPRYKHYLSTKKMAANKQSDLTPMKQKQMMREQNKKLRVFVRHELWIGDLKYDLCTFDTSCASKISDGMRFENASKYFQSKSVKWCDLARESCISFTVYLRDDGANDIAIAFVRFPIISHCNVLRCGKYALNLWPIPVYITEYKGLKCDPYAAPDLSFRYRGTTADRHFKVSKKKSVSKIDKLTGVGDAGAICCWKLGIEFESRKFWIIAPPLNHQIKSQNKIKEEADRLTRQATETHSNLNNISAAQSANSNKRSSILKMFSRKQTEVTGRKSDEFSDVMSLVNERDMLDEFCASERALIWKYRSELCCMHSALSVFLRCVDWRSPAHRSEAYRYLSRWTPSPFLSDSLELLSYEFSDSYVREFAVQRIASMHDSELARYLLQLVQCLKYELYHNNALIRLLQRRALSNPHQIGHFFFWHCFSEYDNHSQYPTELNLMYCERFGLYLEEFLLFSTRGVARDLLIQCNLCFSLSKINQKLRDKKHTMKKNERNAFLRRDLHELNAVITTPFVLPINPRWKCNQFVLDECKTMDSAQMPLWLSCRNIDCDAARKGNTQIIFKTGDDLRQDILTLQILRVMDKIWLDRGLNLRLLPYNVVSTGDGRGMVEIVLCARTTTYIHTTYGGGAQKGAREQSTHLQYLRDVNNEQTVAISKARDIYTRSCAGYCIASYVLGLGDRHPSNIMVRQKGELFHIDFAHFLGNFKSQNIIGDLVKWQREVAPFVFLPASKFVINNANRDDENYEKFLHFAVGAYLALRRRYRLLCNLFILMLPSQMPELINKKHIKYLTNQLHLFDDEKIKNEDVPQHIQKIIKVCLSDKRRIIDNMFHAWAHQ